MVAIRLLTVVVLLAARAALAQPITLATARARAERVGPPVQRAAGQEEVARAEVGVAGALANPTVTVLTAKETARLTAGVSLPLPLFGQRGKAVDAARADAAAAAVEIELARLEARWSATQAWVALWEAQERTQLMALASDDAQRLFDIARTRFEAGSSPRLDVVRATAERARARAEAEAARAAVDAAAARLSPLVAGEGGERLQAAGRPAPPEALPERTELARKLPAHALLRRDRAQVAAAGAHLALEQRLRTPVPSAELTVAHDDPTNEHKTDVMGGLSFELPLLSLRGGAIARARAQRALAETTLALDERQLRADLEDAYHGARAGAARARSLREEVLPAIEEARRMTEESYREGRADILRLLEAQRAVIDARLAALDAVVSWCRALADLERSSGVGLYAK